MNVLLCATLLTLTGASTRQAATDTGIVKVAEPPFQVDEGKILRVVSNRSTFTVGGPKGATFHFQPKVAAESHWVSASLQVNGVDVSVGQFENGKAPVLGYSPTSAEEVAIYRVSAGDKSENLAVYRLKTKPEGLHHLPLRVVDGSLVPAVKPADGFFLFGSHGLIGNAQGVAFSVSLNDYPSGPVQIESVYVDVDYAEAPEVSQASLDPRLSIQGIDQPLSTSAPTTIHLVDLRKKGIVGARITLNGRSVGEFSNIQSGVPLDLSGFNPGSYRMEVFGLLADGSRLGPDSHQVELTDRADRQISNEPAPTLRDFVLESAYYGSDPGQYADVTAKVSQLLSKSNVIAASGGNFGDPAPNFHKQLVIRYTLKGKPGALTCKEGESIDITSALPPPPPIPIPGAAIRAIQVLSADYSGKDVTAKIRELVAHGDISVTVDSGELGINDPAPGSRKTLSVKLIDIHGARRTVTGQEGQTFWLSDEPPTLFDRISNGSFDVPETPGMISEMKYVPAANGVLG
jgi:hypothetical protein